MNKETNHLLLVVISVLLFSACGPLEAVPAPTEAPELIATENPTDMPTGVPVEGSAPESFSSYIGLSYPPFPASLTQDLSMLIQNKDGYGLSLVSDGTSKMLWLNKIIQYDADGNPSWEVRDVLALSDLGAGLTLIPDGCLLNGVPDSEILVAARNGVVVLAWRANTTLDQFEVVAADGIRCNSDKAMNIN
ncbi:MAG TPA: hypothetical protein VN653_16205 [Anaerolineales bacterium]|nr:hypothetical protein [Anaerolineales bacterium]